MPDCWVNSNSTGGCRLRPRAAVSRCCTRPAMTTTGCCAPSSTGAWAAGATNAEIMLRYLQIRDFAIIDSVELEFSGGLTVLTGETGAGKSIIVDALELLCGSRAGADVVRAGTERADICATADISAIAGELRHMLGEQSIDSSGELLLRRVVGGDGRSRAWLNGQAVPVQGLGGVTGLLFEIHGQHEFQSLVRPATQRGL